MIEAIIRPVEGVGPQGPPGGQYEHAQGAASATWGPIVHGLGFYPAVTILDSAGTEVEGEVEHHSRNSLTIRFSVPFSGTASMT